MTRRRLLDLSATISVGLLTSALICGVLANGDPLVFLAAIVCTKLGLAFGIASILFGRDSVTFF